MHKLVLIQRNLLILIIMYNTMVDDSIMTMIMMFDTMNNKFNNQTLVIYIFK